MCGIAGYFAKNGLAVDRGREILEKMRAALHHRGPDEHGYYTDQNAGLASARLSIIDLAGGKMPLSDQSGDLIMVMNGEIYDYRRTREKLIARGHEFATQSDAEVIPHLFAEHGPDTAQHLTGMFAAAVWDRKKKRLWLARDRFGIKPLFWTEVGGILFFASEIKALLANGLVDRKLDPKALRDIGSAGYVMPPRTMFSGVKSLPPATWLLIDADKKIETQYWQLPYPEASGSNKLQSNENFVDTFRALFDEVVRDHLIADVPIGSYLSGGLDSVSVAERATTLSGEKLRTFSMTFPEAGKVFDESTHSDLAAESMGSIHTRVPQGPIDEADYRGTIRAMEAPQPHTVAFCLYRLSRAVKEASLKVVLSGEGADEILAGYTVFKLGKLRRSLFGKQRWIRRLLSRIALGRRQPALHKNLLIWWRFEPQVAERYGLVPPWVEQWWLLAGGWNDVLKQPFEGLDQLPDSPQNLERAADPLHNDLRFEQRSRLDGWVLALGDRLSMAHSIEVRVPFLDHRVAELTARVPTNLLLKGWEEKHLLRAAGQGRLPDALRARQKRAFVAPVAGWLFGKDAPDYVRHALSSEVIDKHGLFRREAIERRLAITRTERRDVALLEASWTLNLALGLHVFCDEFAASI